MAGFLANENVPQAAVFSVRGAGLAFEWMAEIAPGTKDPDVLNYALQHHQVLVTFDKDFGELAFRAGLSATCGIILMRPRLSSPDYVARFVTAVLMQSISWAGHFCVATEGGIRVTRLPGP